MHNAFGLSKPLCDLYEGNNAGSYSYRNDVKSPRNACRLLRQVEHKVTRESLNQASIKQLSEQYLQQLKSIRESHYIPGSWIEFPDFWTWSRDLIFPSLVNSLYGPGLLATTPYFIEIFYDFDKYFPQLAKGVPKLLATSAYQARDRLHKSIMRWRSIELTSQTSQEHFADWSSRFFDHRTRLYNELDFLTAEGAASFDLAFLFA